MTQDFDERVVQRRLDDTVERLQENRRALQDRASGVEAYLLSYAVFEHALAAAGCSRALGHPDDEVRDDLRCAADAAVRLFQLEAPMRELENLDSGESERFVDTSAANPWTFVQAAYAAVVSGDRPACAALGGLDREEITSDQVDVLPSVQRYAVALGHVLADRVQRARDVVADHELGDDGADKRFWSAQIAGLGHILDGDEEAFRKAVDELVAAFETVYAGDENRNNPERLLALPIVGLEALARERLRRS